MSQSCLGPALVLASVDRILRTSEDAETAVVLSLARIEAYLLEPIFKAPLGVDLYEWSESDA